MNETLSLVLVLFLIYLAQCFSLAHPLTVVFFLHDNLRGSLLRRWWRLSPDGKRIFLSNPFLPHVGAVFVERFPFIVRTDSAGRPVGLSAFSVAEASTRSISLQSRHDVCRYIKQVNVDGQPFVVLRSEAGADRAALFLLKLLNASPENRASLIDSEMKVMFSAKEIGQRLESYSQSASYLKTACYSLFSFAFLLGPASTYFLGLPRIWPALLLYLVLSSATILWLFARAYRRLYPENGRWPAQNLFTIGLSPFAAIRANDLLVADLLADFHPVAVAQALLPAKQFLSFASAELRRTRYLHADRFLLKFLEDFIAQSGTDSATLLAPPQRESSNCRSYCPVCHTQFVLEAGACSDCSNVALLPWP